jgi:hypothetical protein
VTESYDYGPLDDDLYEDVEAMIRAMIRAAGQYVRASDDLRPRVLEAARCRSCEKWARRRIRHLAVFVLLLSFFTAVDRHNLDIQRSRPSGMLASTGFNELFSATAIPRSGDGDWRMIDAFTNLRRQQAQVLRFSL